MDRLPGFFQCSLQAERLQLADVSKRPDDALSAGTGLCTPCRSSLIFTRLSMLISNVSYYEFVRYRHG